jgi:hypothetical protein
VEIRGESGVEAGEMDVMSDQQDACFAGVGGDVGGEGVPHDEHARGRGDGACASAHATLASQAFARSLPTILSSVSTETIARRRYSKRAPKED